MTSDCNYDYEILLNDWGFRGFIPIFKDQGIDDESFLILDSETICSISNKAGPRLLFKKKYSEYITSKNRVLNFNLASESISTVSTDTDTYESGQSSSHSFVQDLIIEPGDELTKFLLNENLLVSSESTDASKKRSLQDTDADNNQAKRLRTTENSLETLFKKSAEGQLILANKTKLNNDLRCKIAKIVVGSLINDESLKNSKVEIKTEQFVNASKEIAAFFPGENPETYYIPYSPSRHGLRRQPARGKLWSRYINLKGALRLVNANKQITEPEVETPSTSRRQEDDDKITFLKTAVEPFNKVLLFWEETYSFRKVHYKRHELEEIYSEFPCLALNSGIELLESDYNQKI